MYAADRGRPQGSYQNNWLHCVLPEELVDDQALRGVIRVSHSFAGDTDITLQMEVENLQDGDLVSVTVNGRVVESLRQGVENRITGSLAAEAVQPGANEAVIRLVKRSVVSAEPRTVTALELHVTQR